MPAATGDSPDPAAFMGAPGPSVSAFCALVNPMLHHVTREIAPDRLADCVAFYELLGFRQVEPPASLGERAVWLELGDAQLHLMPVAGATAHNGHIGIVAGGYERTLALMRQAGHEVEPRREHWGSPRAYVRDPAGGTVELMAFPPGGGETASHLSGRTE
jgi:catechol 2,3-dioxygenase-like lactoylglutathione lyase family enzyme